MKKYLVVFAAVLFTMVLAACGGGNDGKLDDGNEGSLNNAEQQPDVNNDDQNAGNGNDNQGEGDGVSHSELEDFEEGGKIKEEIDNLDDLNLVIETDNPNNRVIIFKDGNEVEYKSIFVKRDNHLKIINVKDNEGLVFEGTIK